MSGYTAAIATKWETSWERFSCSKSDTAWISNTRSHAFRKCSMKWTPATGSQEPEDEARRMRASSEPELDDDDLRDMFRTLVDAPQWLRRRQRDSAAGPVTATRRTLS